VNTHLVRPKEEKKTHAHFAKSSWKSPSLPPSSVDLPLSHHRMSGPASSSVLLTVCVCVFERCESYEHTSENACRPERNLAHLKISLPIVLVRTNTDPVDTARGGGSGSLSKPTRKEISSAEYFFAGVSVHTNTHIYIASALRAKKGHCSHATWPMP